MFDICIQFNKSNFYQEFKMIQIKNIYIYLILFKWIKINLIKGFLNVKLVLLI